MVHHNYWILTNTHIFEDTYIGRYLPMNIGYTCAGTLVGLLSGNILGRALWTQKKTYLGQKSIFSQNLSSSLRLYLGEMKTAGVESA